jgi:hypothetical protein
MQTDGSEKRRMDSTQKNLFKSLTKRSEETLGAGAISEEDTSDRYIQEENDFCESLIEPSSGTSRSRYVPDSMFQDEDDKRRKDAADHQAKMSDLSARLTKCKTSSAGASSMPGLTLHPDPTRTQQGANAQTGPHQGSYTHAGPQFMGQPPPKFPNPPPMPPYIPPPQQAAAGYPMGMPPMANYQGIPKLIVKILDGKPDEYQRFKLTFNAAYDDNRHLPQKHLALLLESRLKGRPLTIISEYMRTCIDDLSYARMWKLLDQRYGG